MATPYLRLIRILLIGLPVLIGGCVTPRQNLSSVSGDMELRTGHGIGPTNSAHGRLPEELTLSGGLSDDQAVTIALSNNPAFRELLTELGLSQGDLILAGMLPNPRLAMLVPIGIKPLEMTALYPLEALWLRPRRIRTAALDLDRTADRLVQSGLDLIRDVRVAFADVILARERIEVAEETLQISHQIADLVDSRFRAGDASELDASTSRLEALQIQEQRTRLQRDLEIGENRLRSLLGLGLQPWPPPHFIESPLPPTPSDPSRLVTNALASRPDLRAAEMGAEAAGLRVGLARAETFTLAAGVNVKSVGSERVTGPALELAVPILNQNQGGMALARARLEKAILQYATVRERIAMEVREAHLRTVQARESLDQWNGQILPGLRENVSRAELAFAAGEVSYLFVLESSRRLADARVREAVSRVDFRRAVAELERSVGQRLDPD